MIDFSIQYLKIRIKSKYKILCWLCSKNEGYEQHLYKSFLTFFKKIKNETYEKKMVNKNSYLTNIL